MEYYTLRFTVNVNWNSDNRKWNVNLWKFDDNEWNAENVVFSRTSLYLSTKITHQCVIFVSKPFFHPPIIFPSSCRCSGRVMYFWLSRSLTSHEIIRKNFNASSRRIVFESVGILSSTFWYVAMLSNSKISKNNLSILSPSVYRDFLGKVSR